MSLKMLISCCGIQEYTGTSYKTGEQVLKQYCVDNFDLDTKPNPHTFVLFSFSSPKGKDEINTHRQEFIDLVNSQGLGVITATEYVPNLRYNPEGGNLISAVIFQPDFDKLKEWHDNNK